MNTDNAQFTYQFLQDWLIIFLLGMIFGFIGVIWKHERTLQTKLPKQKWRRADFAASMILGGTASLLLYIYSQLLINASPYLGIVSALVGGLFYPKILPALEKAVLKYFSDSLNLKSTHHQKKY